MLSVAQGPMGAHHHIQAMKARHGHGASPAAQVGTSSPVTGGGLVSVPAAPASGDVEMMQSAASGNNLVRFLTQFEALSGSNPATQQTATSILNDAGNVDLAMQSFAGSVGVSIPVVIVGNDQIVAQQMISGVKAGNTDQTFSSAIVQAENALVSRLQQMATGAQDPARSLLRRGPLADRRGRPGGRERDGYPRAGQQHPEQLHAQLHRPLRPRDVLLDGPDGSLPRPAHHAGHDPLSRCALRGEVDGRPRGWECHAGDLCGHHRDLSAGGLRLDDAPAAMTVVAALGATGGKNSAGYDRVYFKQMIMGHTMALQFCDTLIDTTQNPVLKQFAVNVVPTVFLHRMGAHVLLGELNG